MAEAGRPERPSRLRAAAPPWIGGWRRRVDGRPASPKPTVRRILGLAAGGAAALCITIGLVWLAILYMPLPASQVIPRVEAAIEERLGPGYSVAIADAELRRGANGVELSLVDLRIAKSSGGAPVARVPRAELTLDGLSLLGGDVRVRRVLVTNPNLDVGFDMTVDAASKNADLPDRILAAIGDLDRLLGPDGAAGALEEVEVSGATLLVAPRARAPLALEGVNLRLSRGEGGALALTASSARPDDRWTTAVTVTAPAADGSRLVDLGLENVDLAPYSAPLAEKAGAPPAKGRVSGHLSARIGAGATLIAGDGRLDGRALELALPGPAPEPGGQARSVAIDLVQIGMRWDAAARVVRIEPSQIRAKGGQATFTGALGAPGAPGQPWTAAFDGRDVLLSGESASDPPLRLDRIEVAATFDAASGVLDIGRAQVSGPTAKAAATGLIKFEGASPAVRLGLVSAPMPVSAAKRLWPPFIAHAVRGWVVENVAAGNVETLSLTLDVPSGALSVLGPHESLPVGSLSLDVAFSDGVLRGGAGMPWLEGAKGRISGTSREVEATIERATFSGAENEGALAVQNVLFQVSDTAPRYPKGRLTLRSEGSLRRALAIVGSGAFGTNPLPSQLDVAKVSGEVAADLTIDVELGHDDGQAPKPAVQAIADMRDVRIASVFAGRNFEKGTLRLKVGENAPTLTGKGVVGGAPATVVVSEAPATDRAPARRKLAVTLTADAADFQRLGLDVPGTLRGEVPLQADIPLDDPEAAMTVTADLANVGIDGLAPGFRKPAGRPGRLAFLVQKNADKTVVKDFVLESGDRSVRGTIEFSPKGELLSATMPIYRPGAGDDAKIEIDKAKGGVTKVAVQGAALDLKPLLDRVRGKPIGGGTAAVAADANTIPRNLDVSAKLGTGLGYGGEAVAGLDLQLVVRDGKVTSAEGTGRIGASPIRLATSDDGRLAISGGDAGAFFRFADLYGRIDGGAFDLRAPLAGGPGLLQIRSFAVRNETALDRVRRTTGADQSAPTPAPRGATRFDRLQVSFVQSPGRIRVDEAVVYGPQLGATLAGVVNYSADRVDLVGTFVPIYALNNLISRVPIIGALLGGGKNGGLLGVTFQVKGPTTAPTVSINPMSAVAPGFLRKMFEFRKTPQAADAPTGSKASPPSQGTAQGATSQ